jgi:hypothetical protein
MGDKPTNTDEYLATLTNDKRAALESGFEGTGKVEEIRDRIFARWVEPGLLRWKLRQ